MNTDFNPALLAPSPNAPTPTTREAFDEFVAGTFFRQMLKSLRAGTGEVPYMGGSRAEEVFRERLDGRIADDLAARNGGAWTEDLYETFAAQSLDAPRA